MSKKRISKADRARIVELLRCAADGLSLVSNGAWTDALVSVDATLHVEMVATRAYGAVADGRVLRDGIDFVRGRSIYLEAALRVEQGWTP